MDSHFLRMLDIGLKPLQFDDQGRMYFLAAPFSVTSDGGSISVSRDNWDPRIYRLDGVDSNVPDVLTTSADTVHFFHVLGDGSVVLQADQEATGQTTLVMVRGQRRINLLRDTGWGVNFFTVDDHQSVLFGQYDGTTENGIRIVRPRAESNEQVEQSTLDTRLFGSLRSETTWKSATPRKVMISGNGNVYGLFESSRKLTTGYRNVLTLNQILPYRGSPILEIELEEDNSWWDWMGRTPIQIVGNHVFYRTSVEVPYLGQADQLTMLDMQTMKSTNIIEPGSGGQPDLELSSWTIANNSLHFAGFNLSSNRLVKGELDLNSVKASDNPADSLSLVEVDSLEAALSDIQDIEIVRTPSPVHDPDAEPGVHKVEVDSDNIHSVSIEFTEPMEPTSVEAALQINKMNSPQQQDLDAMPIWVNRTLHLVPDEMNATNETGLAYPGTQPLVFESDYELELHSAVMTADGDAVGAQWLEEWTTRPASGWYVRPDDNLATFVGPEGGQHSWTEKDEWYHLLELTSGEPLGHHYFEFDVINKGSNGFLIDFRDYLSEFCKDNDGGCLRARIEVSAWTHWGYHNAEGPYSMGQGYFPNTMNGTWQTLRIELYGNTFRVRLKPAEDSDDAYVSLLDIEDKSDANRFSTISFGLRQPLSFRRFDVGLLTEQGVETGEMALQWVAEPSAALPTGLQHALAQPLN
ncbi:hypothetical protein [Saccharospirillum sp.]|uniref:hypothetical protein n=1 Tax=Saccharospirillum sp. TaxID=2033801 RepID=UPI00349FE6AC